MKNVFAGGDVVRGGSTVILAMRDGRAAAEAIDRALRAEARINSHPRKREVTSANRIVARRCLALEVAWLEVEAPEIAQHWKAGQFVIVRPTPTSERMPLTIVAGDARLGTIALVVQTVGRTSHEMVSLATGDRIAGMLGPLGHPATIQKFGDVLCVAGGVGTAEVLPVARAFRQAGNHVTALWATRSIGHIILDRELRSAADEVSWSTDAGSGEFHGTVVDLMREWKNRHPGGPDVVHVIGPHSYDARRCDIDPGVGRLHFCQPQSHHGGWNGNVRRMPHRGGRQSALRLYPDSAAGHG